MKSLADGDWEAATRALGERLADAFARVETGLGSPPERLARHPAPQAWSPIEVAEHAALANHHLLLLVEKIAARCRSKRSRGEVPPADPSPLDHLERLARRNFAWESPAHMRPSGSTTARELSACLREQRARCLALLSEMPRGEGALHRIAMSVAGEGARLDLYQYLQVITLHLERHAEQMRRALEAS